MMLMTLRARGTALAAAALFGAMAYVPAAAARSPGPVPAGAKASVAVTTNVQYRRGFNRVGPFYGRNALQRAGFGYGRSYRRAGYRGYRYGYRRGWGRGGAFFGGLAASALIGGALSYPYYSSYSYGYPYRRADYGSSYYYPSYYYGSSSSYYPRRTYYSYGGSWCY